jgi:hypothetical protein
MKVFQSNSVCYGVVYLRSRGIANDRILVVDQSAVISQCQCSSTVNGHGERERHCTCDRFCVVKNDCVAYIEHIVCRWDDCAVIHGLG